MNDFAIDRIDLAVLEEYLEALTGKKEPTLVEELIMDIEVGENADPQSTLTNGLTTLYRACWDLTDLFRIATSAQTRTKKLELVILGLLFEVRSKLDSWVAAQIRNFYKSTDRDPAAIFGVGKTLHTLFEEHRAGLKLVRDRVFHAHPWHSDELIFRVAEAMYRKKVPGTLHKGLVDYGIKTVEQLCRDGIGIPGIGCFGVICIDGRDIPNDTYQLLAHDYWP